MRKLLYDEILAERKTNSEALLAVRHPVSLLLDNIRSLYNVGAMFRTCDSAMAEKLILTGYTPHPPREEIDKTALGATASVPWKYFKYPADAIEELKAEGKKIFALELTDKKRMYDSLLPEDFPLCIVLGNELSGISQNVMQICDDSIEIPMYGVKHSLNVSISGGIALYEAVRIWEKYSQEGLIK